MSTASQPASAQLPLALRAPPDQRFDTFVAAADAAAPALLRAMATSGEPRTMLLVGPAGSGKTHLALATCAAAEAAQRACAYLPLGAAVGRLRDALAALHGNAVVALDGVDAIVGHHDNEHALFDFHNRMHDAGHALLYTAQASPDALPLRLPDLRSRLAQCTRAGLSTLDDAGRAEVLRLRAARRGLAVDDAAIDWLLTRAGRDLITLTALLDRLDRASLAAQRRVTLPFVRTVLGGRDVADVAG